MKKTKKIILLLLILILIISIGQIVSAKELEKGIYITIKINDNIIKTDVNPYIKAERVMVPVRFIAEAFNLEVIWNSEYKKVEIKKEGNIISIWPGTDKIAYNEYTVRMDTISEVLDNRTMVPIRFISEFLDAEVLWEQSTYTVNVYIENLDVDKEYVEKEKYTKEDLLWLSRIIDKEAYYQILDTKVAVGNVVLNRVRSNQFPDNIYDVIFEIDYHVQFPPAHHDDFKTLKPSNDSIIAAKMALEGINNIDNCLFFNYVPFRGKDDDLYEIIDGEYFYY